LDSILLSVKALWRRSGITLFDSLGTKKKGRSSGRWVKKSSLTSLNSPGGTTGAVYHTSLLCEENSFFTGKEYLSTLNKQYYKEGSK
jgi:hypothetical protein